MLVFITYLIKLVKSFILDEYIDGTLIEIDINKKEGQARLVPLRLRYLVLMVSIDGEGNFYIFSLSCYLLLLLGK